MTRKNDGDDGWSKAERESLRKLLRMGLILLLAIIIAGTIAALLSSVAKRYLSRLTSTVLKG